MIRFNRYARVRNLLKLSVVVIAWSVAPMSNADKPEYILPECSFADSLETSSLEISKCSPRLNPSTKFIGIVINGPKEAVWAKGVEPQEASPFGRTSGPARLMIAAIYRFPHSMLGLDGEFRNEILFVAVNQTTHGNSNLATGPSLNPCSTPNPACHCFLVPDFWY